jgi:tRNA(Ile)-lysidine synthase
LSFAIETAFFPYPKDRIYLVAVSGGCDSVVLLHLLRFLGYEQLRVCHLNHNLRGKESRADALFVNSLAKKWGLPYFERTLNQLPSRMSMEEGARFCRLEFYAEAALHFKCADIFLGHHANDQVETFLFNLLRGSSPGNAAMKSETSFTINNQNFRLLRPLLSLWKTDLRDYAKTHRLSSREDSSNRSTIVTRNRIRHEVIPLLEQTMGRDVSKTLLRSSQLAQDDEDFLQSLALQFNIDETLPVKSLAAAPVALARRVIRQWLNRHGVTDSNFEQIEKIRLLTQRLKPSTINLSQDRHVKRQAGKIFLARKTHRSKKRDVTER